MRVVRALVRSVPAAYRHATRRHDQPIDSDRATAQHVAYQAALRSAGFAVEALAGDESLPDGIFVEDTAVIVGERVMMTRSALPGRALERPPIAAALSARGLEVLHMTAGVCDGGDVLLVGGRLFAGISERTDAAGIAALAPLGLPITAIDVPAGVLHLKCVCSPLGDDAILLAEGTLDPAIFRGLQVHAVPFAEQWAANVVALGSRVVMGAGYPVAADRVSRAGYDPILVEVSEIEAGDGSMTCLSLRW